MNFNAAFMVQENCWADLSRGLQIPAPLCSSRAAPGSRRTYGPGVGRAVFLLLSGAANLFTAGADFELTYVSATQPATGSAAQVKRVGLRSGQLIGDLEGASGPYLVGLVAALRGHPCFEETACALHALITLADGLPSRLSDAALRARSAQGPFRSALLRCCDAVYTDLKEALDTWSLGTAPDSPTPLTSPTPLASLWTGGMKLTKEVKPPQTPLDRLRRLVRGGGVALLIGPPATFKTSLAKQAALLEHATLTVLKGAPGVEDRDFYGGVVPTPTGAQWVDGPLTRAFAAAAEGKSTLLIDEALRFLPEYLNVLIGALDTYSPEELIAQDVTTSLETLSALGKRFYALTLPTGETLCAPCQNLSVILTTNMGDDHLQVGERLDAALLSRVNMEIEIRQPDPLLRHTLYFEASGQCSELVKAVIHLEEAIEAEIEGGEDLFTRRLDARRSLSLLGEAAALQGEGYSLREAFLEACETTALPYCTPRDERGLCEKAAGARLRGLMGECAPMDLLETARPEKAVTA